MKYCTLILVGCCMPSLLYATEPMHIAPFSDSSTTSHMMLQAGLSLGVILILILVCSWLAKRTMGLQSRDNKALKVSAALNLGTKERIMIIDVGTQQILVGVCPGRIQMLHVLPEKIEPTELTERPQKGFKDLLQQMTRRSPPA